MALSRRSQVAKFKREGYEKTTFQSHEAADAFIEGLNAGVDPYYGDFDAQVLPPLKKKKLKEWTVYFRVESYEDEEQEDSYFS